ncbi:hypothetical protein, partial [Streptomyces viridochromogenes]|uniref:hypothetical protein n=1 Tax=Streptomyces viridochromogenes TaxID=1938 RepID=UPI001F25F9C0
MVGTRGCVTTAWRCEADLWREAPSGDVPGVCTDAERRAVDQGDGGGFGGRGRGFGGLDELVNW